MSKDKKKKNNEAISFNEVVDEMVNEKAKERKEKEMEENKKNEVVTEEQKAEVMVEEKKGLFGFLKDHKKVVIGGLVLTGLVVGGYYAYKMMTGNTTDDLPLDEAAVDVDAVDVPFEDVAV